MNSASFWACLQKCAAEQCAVPGCITVETRYSQAFS